MGQIEAVPEQTPALSTDPPEATAWHKVSMLAAVIGPFAGLVGGVVSAWRYGYMNWLYLSLMLAGWLFTGTGITVGYKDDCNLNEVLRWTATGWACVTVATLSPVTSVAGKTGAVTLNANDVWGLGTAALKNFGTAAGELVELDSSARLPAVNGGQLTQINAVRLQGRTVSSNAPNANEVLTWNSTTSAWTATALPTAPVVSVAGRTGAVTLERI